MRDIYPKYGLPIFRQTTRSEVVIECNGAVFCKLQSIGETGRALRARGVMNPGLTSKND